MLTPRCWRCLTVENRVSTSRSVNDVVGSSMITILAFSEIDFAISCISRMAAMEFILAAFESRGPLRLAYGRVSVTDGRDGAGDATSPADLTVVHQPLLSGWSALDLSTG